MNNTIIRTITGIFIILFVVLPIWAVNAFSYAPYVIVFSIMCFLSLKEFYSIVSCSTRYKPLVLFNTLTGTIIFLVVAAVVFIKLPYHYLIIPWLMILAGLGAEMYRKKEKPLENIAYGLTGLLWIALPFAGFNLLFLPQFYDGPSHLLPASVFIFLWVNDTGAYVFGLAFGKRRLFKRISPKKSWEGFIAGVLSTIVTAYIISIFWTGFSFYVWGSLAIVVAVSGTFGDLTESLFKRNVNCKDSGQIFPGHGGFLDRFDCLFFAVPATLSFLIIKNIFGI